MPQFSNRPDKRHVIRVSSDGDRRAQVRWFVAFVVWVAAALLNVVMLRDVRSDIAVILVVILAVFDLIPLTALALAIRSTLHNRRYGRLELELDPSPGCLGGRVGGVMDLPILPSGRDKFRVILSCERRTEYDDGDLSTHLSWRVLWKSDQASQVEALPDRVRVRFAFDVPATLLPTGEDADAPIPGYSTIHWRARVKGHVPRGVNLNVRFELPVERLEQPVVCETAGDHPPSSHSVSPAD